jgi:tetratricopeptide (TPR) repeat protein
VCDLRVELVVGEDERLLFSEIWKIPGPITQGDPLLLGYRLDENQVLDLWLKLADAEHGGTFATVLENPLTYMVNPHAKRLMIEQLEEALRTGKIPREAIPETMIELAEAYADLGQREKAVEYLGRVLRSRNAPDAWLLHRMAMYYGEMGDFEREEKCYREAAAVSSWSETWFNLAHSQQKQGLHTQAAATLDNALLKARKAPYLVLKAQIHRSLGDQQQQQKALQEALQGFGAVVALDDWELSWFLAATRMAGDRKKISQGEAELRHRRRSTGAVTDEEGVLPALTAVLKRVEQ